MRLAFISDTHGLHSKFEMPETDLLIHAGDFCNGGLDINEVVSFNHWLDSAPIVAHNRIVISGNHDQIFDKTHRTSSKEKAAQARRNLRNCVYLEDEYATIKGLKIYGSPWTPRFFDWGFNADRGEDIKKYWDKIPDDTEILVTHGPPYGILDQITPLRLGGVDSPLTNHHLGCEELAKRVRELKNLKIHVFGHIHGSRGQWQHHTNGVPDGPLFINASALTERYKPWPNDPGYFVVEV